MLRRYTSPNEERGFKLSSSVVTNGLIPKWLLFFFRRVCLLICVHFVCVCVRKQVDVLLDVMVSSSYRRGQRLVPILEEL